MTRSRRNLLSFGAGALLAGIIASAAPPVRAQGVPGLDPNKCLAGKTKCVNKKIAGLLKCREKCQKNPVKCGQAETDCAAKVMAKFDGGTSPAKSCFAKLEAKDDPLKPDSVCTTTGNVAAMEAQVDAAAGDLVATLEGNPPPACQAFPATGQTTCWDGDGNVVACAGTGHDGDVQAGAALAYADNGDGTVTDLNTGLMWEKKSDDGTLHDKDSCYPWYGVCSGNGTTKCGRDAHCAGAGGTCDAGDCESGSPNGLTIFEWLDALNAASFAGYTDWRVPNVKELQSLLDFERVSPSVPPALNTGCTDGCTVTTCSCTRASPYWSATAHAFLPTNAWAVSFSEGIGFFGDKSFDLDVRAVRSGS